MTAKRRILVVGAGGQAREIESYIRALGDECVGFIVSDLTKVGQYDSRERILGDESWLHAHSSQVDAIALGIGTPGPRLAVGQRLRSAYRVPWPAVVHPSAVFDRGSVTVSDGVMIGPGAVVTVNVTLAEFSMVNFGATVGHETQVGAGSVIHPQAAVGGGVTIGKGVLVGAGAVVLQYRTIGDGATIGAGAVVTRDVAPGATVTGTPARASRG